MKNLFKIMGSNKSIWLMLLLIIGLSFFVADSCNGETQDNVLSQFRDDQIECLKHKVSISESINKILLSEKIIIQQIAIENDENRTAQASLELQQLELKLSKLLKLKDSGKYSCNDDSDDKFLDSFSYKIQKVDNEKSL